jgi:ATP synthase alpha/beta chain, C terminal domain
VEEVAWGVLHATAALYDDAASLAGSASGPHGERLHLWSARGVSTAAVLGALSAALLHTKRVLDGERLTQILKQDQFATMSTSIQTVLLYAGSKVI